MALGFWCRSKIAILATAIILLRLLGVAGNAGILDSRLRPLFETSLSEHLSRDWSLLSGLVTLVPFSEVYSPSSSL